MELQSRHRRKNSATLELVDFCRDHPCDTVGTRKTHISYTIYIYICIIYIYIYRYDILYIIITVEDVPGQFLLCPQPGHGGDAGGSDLLVRGGRRGCTALATSASHL